MHNTTQHNTTQRRIEYLDALRGFTMLLVVMSHVSTFTFGTGSAGSINIYLQQFRMPLFFFVSGFVFYKDNFKWNISNIVTFLKKKITVQIITPLIFLLCYIHVKDIPFMSSLKDVSKSGYWFTFTLFNYFLIYIVTQKILDLFKTGEKWRFPILILLGISLYNNFPINIPYRMGYSTEIYILGLAKLQCFLFFIIGCFIKKHFRQFENTIDKTPLIICAIAIYFTINLFVETENLNHHIKNNISLLLGVCGILIVFSLFRKHQTYFSSNNRISNLLKFIGKRTLDIYLLHYFLLPVYTYKNFPIFIENNFPIIEFAASLALTSLIVAGCLAISSVLRINSTMAHYMFGAKKK